jgi:small nuclear ribonucleoprotein (snRNP)-like protein
MLINSLIGKQVLVKLTDGGVKGTLQRIGNHFILVDEKYININHIVIVSEATSKKEKTKLYITD